MQKIFLWACLSLVSGAIFAQKAEVKLGDDIRKERTFSGHLHSDATGHYVLFYESGGQRKIPIIEKYDQNFKQVFSKSYLVDNKNMTTFGTFYLKGKLVMTFCEHNKKADKLNYFLVPISLNGVAEKPKPIVEYAQEKSRDFPNVNVRVSEDSTKILFVMTNKNMKSNISDPTEMYVAVMDTNFDKKWEKKINFTETIWQISFFDFAVNEKEEFIFVSKVYNNHIAKQSKRGKAAYSYFLNILSKDAAKPRQIKIDLQGDFVQGITFKVAKNGDMVLLGFYANKLRDTIQGIFNLKVKSDGTIAYMNKEVFAGFDLALLGGKDKREVGMVGSGNRFIFENINIREDGSLSVTCAENFFITLGNSSITNYYSMNIISIDVDKAGKPEKIRIVPKKQVCRDIGHIVGYEPIITNENIYYFYNDDKDNLQKTIYDKTELLRETEDIVMIMTYFDKITGQLVSKDIMDRYKTNENFTPAYSRQINRNQLFFVALNNTSKKLRLGVVTITE